MDRMDVITEAVAKAICKSRSCEGAACCQWPANGGRSIAECPVWRGGYTDAAKAAIEAMDVHGNFKNWIEASRDAIAGKGVGDLYDAMPTDHFQQSFK